MRPPAEALGMTDDDLARVRPTMVPAAAREVADAQAEALAPYRAAEALIEEPRTRRSGWLRKAIDRIRRREP